MSNIKQKIFELSLLSNYGDYESSELTDILKFADDSYYNTNNSAMSDEEYDALKCYISRVDPYNTYLKQVGVQVRTGKTKLPHPMGSLDQLYVGGDVANWIIKHKLRDEMLIATEKLDGVSGMVVYDENGNFSASYSRGDGLEGAIIDRHLTKIKSVPSVIKNTTGKPVFIRGEIIFTKPNFLSVQQRIKTRGGDQYKNARNCIAGLMNAERNDLSVYNSIDFVAYQIVDSTEDKKTQLDILENNGFKIPFFVEVEGKKLSDNSLTNLITTMKANSDYELDGVVVDINDSTCRASIRTTERDTLNPSYAVKFKVASSDNCAITSVVNVEWSRSKHGYLKPVVVFEPVQLCGVTITRATAFNAAFIWNNKIGVGSKIEIIRSGDVIPFINQVVTQTSALMPTDEWEWNETGVDAVVIDPEQYADVQINRMVDFFSTLNIAHLKEGSISTLYSNNYNSVEKIINMSENKFIELIGENGKKIYNSMIQRLSSVQLHELIGAHSTARGIGVRKMKKLQKVFGMRLIDDVLTVDEISNVDGFDVKTASQVVFALEQFKMFLAQVHEKVNFVEEIVSSDGFFKDKCFVFTGFRDSDLEKTIERNGGTIASGVSKKVTTVVAKDTNEKSTKIQKANQLGIQVISLDTLTALIEDNI